MNKKKFLDYIYKTPKIDVLKIKEFKRKKVDLNSNRNSENNSTLAHILARESDHIVFRFCVENLGLKPSALDKYEKNPVFYCLENNLKTPQEKRKFIITYHDLKGNLTHCDSEGQNVLHLASKKPYCNGVIPLLKSLGVSDEKKDYNQMNPIDICMKENSIRNYCQYTSPVLSNYIKSENTFEILDDSLEFIIDHGLGDIKYNPKKKRGRYSKKNS